MIESVDIKDLSNITRFSTPINEGSKRKFLLMKEDYITLKFSVGNPIYFKLGDGIDNELGVFELVDLCKPTFNQNTGGYDYELRLDAYYWKWKNKKFFFTPENAGREASWNLTADLATHMKVFLKNLKALGYKFREDEFVCEIDKTVASSSKPISYDNCNLIDALTQMAEAWECEWWITNHTINFGRCEYNDPVDFKVGDSADNEGVNVNTMQRSDSQTTYATRIYAFGSDRNIPKTYRKKLVFDAAVDGRYIYDASRKLKDDFFPIGSKIIPQPIENKYLSGEAYGFNTDGKIELEDIIDTNIPAGIYTLDLTNVEIKLDSRERANDDSFIPANVNIDVIISGFYVEGDFSSPRFVVKSLKNVKIVASGDGWTYLDIKETFYAQFKYENATFRVCLDVYNIDDTPYWGKFRLYYKGDFIIWKERIRYNTSVTFLSGVNKDKEYKCSYFPEILGKKNVIQMPENTTVSTGDTYTIDNIIKGKVDASYFSKDDNETTINGVVQTRLMLPVNVPYVDAHLNMTQDEAVEEIVVFDDVYAKYIGTTTEVPEPEWEFEKEDDKPTENKYPVYTFKDTGLKNFTEYFVLDKLRLVFQTGNLSGLDFALKLVESDDTGTTFRITRNDDYGRFLPDDVLFPQADHMNGETKILADTYILYGFDTAFISEDMLPKAEEELLKKAQEHVKKSQIDPSTYNCDMFCQYAYNEGNIRTFEVGDRVNLINKAYFENGRQSRIIGYEWNLDIPYDHPIYTVGETAAYSRIGEIESKIDSLSYKGQTYAGGGTSGGGSSVYVIGVNDKTLPSDRNVFSAKRSFEEFVSKKKDDRAAGHLTLEQGATSEGLIQANGGLVVRKEELVEEAFMSLVEESEDSLIEEIDTGGDGPGATTTLGGLTNVNDNADTPSETDDLLVRLAGSAEWSVNSNLFSHVSQLMTKVFPFTMNLSGGGTYEKGSSQTVNLSWTYDRDIESQSINNESLAIGIRSKQYANVMADKTYTLSTVCSGQTYTRSVSAQFKTKKYYGVSDSGALTNAQILALSSAWAQRAQGSTVFDCTVGKYPYYILPTSLVSGIQFWIGGLRNTDWTEEVREVTNAYGHAESYTIFRLNSIQTGVLNIEVR